MTSNGAACACPPAATISSTTPCGPLGDHVVDGHGSARSGQREGGGPSHALPGAGDQRALALEVQLECHACSCLGVDGWGTPRGAAQVTAPAIFSSSTRRRRGRARAGSRRCARRTAGARVSAGGVSSNWTGLATSSRRCPRRRRPAAMKPFASQLRVVRRPRRCSARAPTGPPASGAAPATRRRARRRSPRRRCSAAPARWRSASRRCRSARRSIRSSRPRWRQKSAK